MSKDISLIEQQIEQVNYQIMEKVIAEGDLSKLTPKERCHYYHQVCKSLNLNPLTKPFQFIRFDGKMVLYASKDCTEQMRMNNGISITKIEKEIIGDIYNVTAYIQAKDGRTDVATGAVYIKGVTGKQLANAYKVAETQAKRRATLSICGLGWTDESEINDVPNAEKVHVDFETGEIIEAVKEQPKSLDQYLILIRSSQTLDDLRQHYTEAYKIYVEARPMLIKLKDETIYALQNKTTEDDGA